MNETQREMIFMIAAAFLSVVLLLAIVIFLG
jgi:hypothetical protein